MLSIVGVVHVAHTTISMLIPRQWRLQLVLLCHQNFRLDLIFAHFFVIILLFFDLLQVVGEPVRQAPVSLETLCVLRIVLKDAYSHGDFSPEGWNIRRVYAGVGCGQFSRIDVEVFVLLTRLVADSSEYFLGRQVVYVDLLVHMLELVMHLKVFESVRLLQNLVKSERTQTNFKIADHEAPGESGTVHHGKFRVCAFCLLCLITCQFLDQLLMLIMELDIHRKHFWNGFTYQIFKVDQLDAVFRHVTRLERP